MTRTNPFTYAEALVELSRLQSNTQIRSQLASSPQLNNSSLTEMRRWLSAGKVPLQSGFQYVHVAGTKGKGSVCTFISQALRETLDSSSCRGDHQGVGLFTSPHLVSVRERISIDGRPISKERFAGCLGELVSDLRGFSGRPIGGQDMPGFFRLVFMLALKAFQRENVAHAVMECGIGGEYDATNVLSGGLCGVSVVTQLQRDHVDVLGKELTDIAWHKTGIFKYGRPAVTKLYEGSAEMEHVMNVVRKRAQEKGVRRLVGLSESQVARWGGVKRSNVALLDEVECMNQALAAVAVMEHLQMEYDPDKPLENIPETIISGLRKTRIRGRGEVLVRDDVHWVLDGAHTPESLHSTALSFGRFAEEDGSGFNVLVFNQQEREVAPLVEALMRPSLQEITKGFDLVVFTRNEPLDAHSAAGHGHAEDLEVQNHAADVLETLGGAQGSSNSLPRRCIVTGSVSEAVDIVDSALTLLKDGAGGCENTTESFISRPVTSSSTSKYRRDMAWLHDLVRSRVETSDMPKRKAAVLVAGSMKLVGGVLGVLENNAD